ncbi:hypothetical protein [Rhizobium halophytocola]|uniref:Terminase small subunit n=1 Tax=Rhizobium halophytocola TaxID=735519 RepID=A0ABS4E2F5_9HYPH|nr:hypothetical protein [Rhizobium halophytocola]MBP1852131.1 hypothetical protein [Rhizobium halophytocola]
MEEEWISITEAAQRLTVTGDRIDRSTLSRYLKQHGEALPLKADGKSNLVDFNALVAHRAENIRIRVAAPAPGQPSSRATASTGGDRFTGTQSNGAARKAQAEAELREMDLAKRRREVTPIDEVDQAGRDAVAMMLGAFERAIESEGQTLSLKYGWDERTVRLALKTFTRAGLGVFNRQILERLDAMRRQEDASEAGFDEETETRALQ